MNKIILINAIIWAGLILLSGWLFGGDDNYYFLFGALLVGFTFINSLLAKEQRKEKQKNCLK